jgi:bifunctional DNA-binding transcriptional regulator/antitoxin component of YhaV-PrlF toxin-antitoxin module
MKTTVSIRGRTVIPHKIRERMGIVLQTRLEWRIREGMIVVFPIPPDPVRATVGLLEGQRPNSEDLLAERKKERGRA